MTEQIKKAHESITRIKGKDYAPNVHEIQEEILNNLIFDALRAIHTDEKNEDQYGQVGVWYYQEDKLKSVLPEEAIAHIHSGKCPYGNFTLYGGRFGTYKAITLSNEYYKKCRNIN